MTFSSGSVSTNLIVDVINPVYEPVFEPIPTFLATPAANAKKIIPVVILRYLPTQDGINNDTRYDPDFGSLNPIGLTQLKTDLDKYDLNVKYCLEEGTKFRGYKTLNAQPYLGYKVMAIITVYEPTPQGIILNYDNNGNIRYAPDFQQIFDRFNIKNYIENLGVRDIWFWSGGFDSQFPSYNPAIHKLEYFRGTWESNMSSPTTGDISNSNRDQNDLPVYSQPYMVYGQNYRRTQAEAIHNRGHQYEAMLSHIDAIRNGNTDLFWKKFVGQNSSGQFITGRCGWTHMPPNTTGGYDYTNTTLAESDCEDWTPQGTGQKKMVNASTWGNLTYNWPQPTMNQKTETQFYTYWFQNYPGYQNRIPHSVGFEMSNWWEIIGNFDSAVVNNMNLFKVKLIAIPVELIDITAKANEQKNLIEWQTASEVNFKGFAIERLIGNNWEKLDFVPAYGKGSHYQFTDEYPLSISYYRLRQIDNDGKETFSKVVNVQRNGKSNIKIYPSVVESELRVKYEDVNKSMEVQIVNIMGQVVYQQVHTFSNGEMVLNVSSLQAGTYFLQIDNNTAKIIKK